ncbi:hypothetical protein AVEN_208972-1 [Araneus ventricosus]|uniref:Uncharacterized protein n=1 Tax=Araneus ventricosus TaxID=182803 RepID=A0A4Y2CQV6_ARAVE|nr:hypothetical protein AVEN_208972-1 [Araneus ventricosus]
MSRELLDDTLDESFEETNSGDCKENEVEELETEVSEDTEKWADDGDLKKIPFQRNPGPGIFTVLCHTRKFDGPVERRFHVKLFWGATCTHGVQSSYLYEVTDFYCKHVF